MFGFVAQRVYVQLFSAYALGVALGFHAPPPGALLLGSAGWIWGALAALACLWWLLCAHHSRYAFALLLTLVACAGWLNVTLMTAAALGAPLRAVASQVDYVRGTVVSIPKYQGGMWRLMLQVDRARLTQDGRAGALAGKPAPSRSVPGDGTGSTGGSRYWNGTRYWVSAPGRVLVYFKAPAEPPVYCRQRLTVRGKPTEEPPPPNRGQFNYRRYLLGRGTVLTLFAPAEQSVHRLSYPERLWVSVSALRTYLIDGVSYGLPPELAQLAASVVFGDKVTDLPDDTQERFRNAGLTHILVASGTQVSLLIVLLALAFWRIGDNATWRGRMLNAAQFGATLAVVLAYGAVTGYETSIVRALVMGVVVLIGKATSREADGLSALAQAGLAVLVMSPLELFAPGFQLSFGATFGLIYAAGACFPLIEPLSGWKRALGAMLITTGGAQLFVAPLLAAQFNQLSLWGLFSNFLAIPLAFALLIAGGAQSLGLAWIPLVGWITRWVVEILTWLLDTVARIFSSLPGSNIAVPTPPVGWLLGCYALLFLAGELVKAWRTGKLDARWVTATRALAPALGMVLLAPVLYWQLVPQTELAVFSLGKGRACIWRARGHTALVLRHAWLTRSHHLDTLASALRCRGISRLDAVVWLDAPMDNSPLPDYPARGYLLDGSVPRTIDLASLRSSVENALASDPPAEVDFKDGKAEVYQPPQP